MFNIIFSDFNEDQNIKIKNNYGDREPNLNNFSQVENDINNNKKSKIVFKKENIYSYEFGDKNNKNAKNNYQIENVRNNVNYKDEKIESKNSIKSSSISYFVYVLDIYLKKKCYLLCAYEIANFQKKYEKNLSLKLLFMVIKKRIIFYKIKFFHRYKKIYKYLVKYKKNNNNAIGGTNQRKRENKISGYKK